MCALTVLVLPALSGCSLLGPEENGGERCEPESVFAKRATVLGLSVYGTEAASDESVTHVATILAEYLDNGGVQNEDGTADDEDVLAQLRDADAIMVVAADQDDFEALEEGHIDAFGGCSFADVHETGIHPDGTPYEADGPFDESLEEVLHLVTQFGYSEVYADTLGEAAGSAIAEAMDSARGGHYEEIPSSYPAEAWFTYDDASCDYACQITEYTYWVVTTAMGIQTNRAGQIDTEWKVDDFGDDDDLVEAADLQEVDQAAWDLLENSTLPRTAPDGSWAGGSVQVDAL